MRKDDMHDLMGWELYYFFLEICWICTSILYCIRIGLGWVWGLMVL
jgi:hypothetical protein